MGRKQGPHLTRAHGAPGHEREVPVLGRAVPRRRQRGARSNAPWARARGSGLWRESAKSGYNVPFGLEIKSGKRSSPHLNFEAMTEAAELLSANRVRLLCADFAETIAQVARATLSTPICHILVRTARTARRASVSLSTTSWRACSQTPRSVARCAGCRSNSVGTRTNYCEIWGGTAHELSARRSIGCKVASRGVETELLIKM
jgi:hypothetical protein